VVEDGAKKVTMRDPAADAIVRPRGCHEYVDASGCSVPSLSAASSGKRFSCQCPGRPSNRLADPGPEFRLRVGEYVLRPRKRTRFCGYRGAKRQALSAIDQARPSPEPPRRCVSKVMEAQDSNSRSAPRLKNRIKSAVRAASPTTCWRMTAIFSLLPDGRALLSRTTSRGG